MTIQKIAAFVGMIALVSGWWTGAWGQQFQSGQRGYGTAGASPQSERRPPPARPGNQRPPPSVHADYHSIPYRPPVAVAPPLRYRQPAVIVTPPIVVGSVLPYGYGGYPIDNWGYYNLSAPCCGQYWVQYGQSFLLVSPDGVVLQVFTP